MKLKIIKTFAATATAVCVVYGTIASSYRSISGQTATSTTSATTVAIAEAVSIPATKESSSASSSATSSAASETQITKPTTSTKKETISPTQPAVESKPTLNEYLSKLRCGGCGRNCLLINPRCNKGSKKAQTATQQYYTKYGNSVSLGDSIDIEQYLS